MKISSRPMNCHNTITITSKPQTEINTPQEVVNISSIEVSENPSLQTESKIIHSYLSFFTSASFFWMLVFLGPLWFLAGVDIFWRSINGYESFIPLVPNTFSYNLCAKFLNVFILGITFAPWLTLLGLFGVWFKSSTFRTRLCAVAATVLYLGALAWRFGFL